MKVTAVNTHLLYTHHTPKCKWLHIIWNPGLSVISSSPAPTLPTITIISKLPDCSVTHKLLNRYIFYSSEGLWSSMLQKFLFPIKHHRNTLNFSYKWSLLKKSFNSLTHLCIKTERIWEIDIEKLKNSPILFGF